MAEQTRAGTLGSSSATNQTGTSSGSNESIVGRVRDRATEQLNTQKNKATEGLGSVAHAVRDTTQRLRDENHDTVARFVEQAADQIERFSSGLKNKDVGELVNDAQRLARRQPALFVGGAFAVGLLSARFLKSSSPRDSYDRPYGALERTDYGTSPGYSGSTNAYGNRVPTSAGTASTSSTPTGTAGGSRARTTSASRGPDYKPTEGM
jgi:hypothetical protein